MVKNVEIRSFRPEARSGSGCDLPWQDGPGLRLLYCCSAAAQGLVSQGSRVRLAQNFFLRLLAPAPEVPVPASLACLNMP